MRLVNKVPPPCTETLGGTLAVRSYAAEADLRTELLFVFCLCSDANEREWSEESNVKLPPLFSPSKTVPLVPKFSKEDLPLSRNATLVLGLAVEDLPLGRTF